MSINKAFISGNLARDAELRDTNGGTPVLNFTVASTDRKRNSQTGEWEDYTNWIDCTLFGNRAKAVEPYLKKGTKVMVEGRLRWSQWEKDGQKRSKIGILVDEIEFMSRNGGGRGDGGSYSEPSAPAPAPADDVDDDVPF